LIKGMQLGFMSGAGEAQIKRTPATPDSRKQLGKTEIIPPGRGGGRKSITGFHEFQCGDISQDCPLVALA
jgi:hypothetical protein